MNAPRRAASKENSFLSSSGRVAPIDEFTRPEPSLVSSSGPVIARIVRTRDTNDVVSAGATPAALAEPPALATPPWRMPAPSPLPSAGFSSSVGSSITKPTARREPATASFAAVVTPS
eukprot:scaffold52843_cov73-Phaeocystis_antarctica.AAC.2